MSGSPLPLQYVMNHTVRGEGNGRGGGVGDGWGVEGKERVEA